MILHQAIPTVHQVLMIPLLPQIVEVALEVAILVAAGQVAIGSFYLKRTQK